VPNGTVPMNINYTLDENEASSQNARAAARGVETPGTFLGTFGNGTFCNNT